MFDKETLKYDGPEQYNSSSYTGIFFGACHEPKDGKVRLVSSTHSCRDGFGTKVRESIMSDDGSFVTDKCRILFRWSGAGTNNEEWALRGLAAMHAAEKCAGWPLTRMQKVEMGVSNQKAVYCRGSRRWIKAPYLLTLYILLMRMCADDRIQGFKDIDGLIKTINSISSLKRDNDQVRKTVGYWKALLLAYPEMFQKKKITYYWDTDRIKSDGYGEGIYRLCNNSTSFPELYKILSNKKRELETKK